MKVKDETIDPSSRQYVTFEWMFLERNPGLGWRMSKVSAILQISSVPLARTGAPMIALIVEQGVLGLPTRRSL